MMDLKQIAVASQKAARKAAREHKQPYIWEAEDVGHVPPFPFPNIGDYRPKEWELTGSYFVDSSGFGAPGEGALTAYQFKLRLKPGFGYAVIEAGEFQVYVGEFKQVKKEVVSRFRLKLNA